MQHTQTIAYDDKTSGRKVLGFPPKLPFADARMELKDMAPESHQVEALSEISGEATIFARATCLAELLAGAREPHKDILRIASLAADYNPVGFQLMYASLLALPPRQTMIADLAEFTSVNRMMQKISKKEKAGGVLRESEDWFKKKVMMLSMSLPLPNVNNTPTDAPWTAWCEGVRLALADPDPRWDKAVLERAKVELEALELRIKMLVVSLDPERMEDLSGYLFSLSEETRWRKEALDEDSDKMGKATLVIQKKIGERWKEIISALEQTDVGKIIVDLFRMQTTKAHSYPHIKTGAAVLHALMTHPVLKRGGSGPDGMSCIHLYAAHAGGGLLELLIKNSSGGKDLQSLVELSGLELSEKVLSIDLKKAPSALFVDSDGVPREIDWFEVQKNKGLSYRSLVLTYMDNDSFLSELLNNPKATSKPGVISMIALRCRSSKILSMIANRRDLYTGFAGKEVPMNLLLNPTRVSVSALRKFIHVRYIDRPTLQRLSQRGSPAREEVRREISRYLNNLG
jgi:hypothetical protein